MIAYPICFTPIFKERLWGGNKLKTYLNKNITSDFTGESWEISTVSGEVSVVENGFYKGKNLNDLLVLFPKEILGNKVYEVFGSNFPLLFKFLDAKQDLSIQLHPNDELASQRHNSFGKTEMWYVLQANENARLIVGFKENTNQKEYLDSLEKNEIVSLLNEYPVKKGDVFLLETGTIHAIGAGCVIAEIQQTSDVTYRVFDYNRKDENGNERELHTDLALDAINYNITPCKKHYEIINNKFVNVVNCKYFNTNILKLEGNFIWQKTKDSFTVIMCTEGSFSLLFNGEITDYTVGNTVLIPAIIEKFELKGKANLLEITI